MSEWKTRRFWKQADVQPAEGGFAVALDGRLVKTPAKAPLVVPTQALAREIAAEWDAQQGEIAPLSMPMTRSANAAIDKVATQHAEVADMIAAYGDSDLLCYRATGPEDLVARQRAAWDPLLDWAAERFGARLVPVSGVMHCPQEAGALARLAGEVHAQPCFALTALHDLVALSGSLVIGLAALEGVRDIDALWRVSRVDELWQQERWGDDEEASALSVRKAGEFAHARRFGELAGAGR